MYASTALLTNSTQLKHLSTIVDQVPARTVCFWNPVYKRLMMWEQCDVKRVILFLIFWSFCSMYKTPLPSVDAPSQDAFAGMLGFSGDSFYHPLRPPQLHLSVGAPRLVIFSKMSSTADSSLPPYSLPPRGSPGIDALTTLRCWPHFAFFGASRLGTRAARKTIGSSSFFGTHASSSFGRFAAHFLHRLIGLEETRTCIFLDFSWHANCVLWTSYFKSHQGGVADRK
jgi:hypothetical protein